MVRRRPGESGSSQCFLARCGASNATGKLLHRDLMILLTYIRALLSHHLNLNALEEKAKRWRYSELHITSNVTVTDKGWVMYLDWFYLNIHEWYKEVYIYIKKSHLLKNSFLSPSLRGNRAQQNKSVVPTDSWADFRVCCTAPLYGVIPLYGNILYSRRTMCFGYEDRDIVMYGCYVYGQEIHT